MTRSKIRTLIVGAVSAVVLVPSATLAVAAARPRPHHVSHHHVTRSHHVKPRPSGIPQHNGGDRDSDNNGAPSDGDGNQ